MSILFSLRASQFCGTDTSRAPFFSRPAFIWNCVHFHVHLQASPHPAIPSKYLNICGSAQKLKHKSRTRWLKDGKGLRYRIFPDSLCVLPSPFARTCATEPRLFRSAMPCVQPEVWRLLSSHCATSEHFENRPELGIVCVFSDFKDIAKATSCGLTELLNLKERKSGSLWVFLTACLAPFT